MSWIIFWNCLPFYVKVYCFFPQRQLYQNDLRLIRLNKQSGKKTFKNKEYRCWGLVRILWIDILRYDMKISGLFIGRSCWIWYMRQRKTSNAFMYYACFKNIVWRPHQMPNINYKVNNVFWFDHGDLLEKKQLNIIYAYIHIYLKSLVPKRDKHHLENKCV